MSDASGYLVTPSQRRTLLAGPLGAVLLLGGDATAGSLSLVEHNPGVEATGYGMLADFLRAVRA